MIGRSLGHYQIVAKIGEGGMGTVYRAHDDRLGRDVAIKVVLAPHGANPDQLRRFEQEARAAAALNHPNLIAVYDVGQHEGSPYIVTELLDGESLRAHCQTPLSVTSAVNCAVQITRGLAAAHDKGIVHRDLKPENIFVTTDGRLKILDFGLAKLVQPEAPAGASMATAMADTRGGTVLGTVGYMAPEQARGLPVDHRADIFAFGAVLYEMVAGARAFTGETAADVMTAILKEEPPPLSAAARPVPLALARIVERCLAKNPAARFRSADDLAFALESLSLPSSLTGDRPAIAGGAATSRPSTPWIGTAAMIGLGVVTGGAAMALVAGLQPTAAVDARPVIRLELPMPERLRISPHQAPAVSPDGSRIAVVALDRESQKHSIFLRALDSETAQPVTGTDRAAYPFWSPDGRRLAFFADGRLKTVDVATGALQDVCSAPNPAGPGSWAGDTIVFGRGGGPIVRVPASGGRPVPDLPTTSTQLAVGFLSDRTRVIVGSRNGLEVRSADGRAPEILTSDYKYGVLQAPWLARGSESDAAPGHLLFVRQNTLWAHRIDGAGRFIGAPAAVAQSLAQSPLGRLLGSAQSSVLAYLGGTAASSRLTWFSRTGTRLGQAVSATGFLRDPRLAPDGSKVAVSRFNAVDEQYDLLLLDLARDTASRLASGASAAIPSWLSASDLIVTRLMPRLSVARVAAREGAPMVDVLAPADSGVFGPQVTPDGRTLLYVRVAPDGDFDLFTSPMDRPEHGSEWLKTPAHEFSPRLSPDGRWVAYVSNPDPAGPVDVFVMALDKREKQQVSRGGGSRPVWRGDGRELFFLSPDGDLMAAPVATSPALRVGAPERLFRTPIDSSLSIALWQFDAAADGQRFLIATPESDAPQPVNVIVNWQSLLQR